MSLNFYQHLPAHIDPIVFSFGFFSMRWYALMYIIGLIVVYGLLTYRVKKGETSQLQKSKIPIEASGPRGFTGKNQNENSKLKTLNKYKSQAVSSREQAKDYKLQNIILDFLLYAFVSALIGGRLGYVIFYNSAYYVRNPLAIISPFDSVTGQYAGIYGMSYFGAFIAVLATTVVFCKIRKMNFWQFADFVVPAIPAGYFFGRIGNFLNGELYGYATSMPWGMYFPGDAFGLLRHPSQIYEALLEGLLLFVILWAYRNKAKFSGQLVAMYAIGYAVARFFCEFFRQNDFHGELFFAGSLTLGQIFSLILALLALWGYFERRRCAILKQEKEVNSNRRENE